MNKLKFNLLPYIYFLTLSLLFFSQNGHPGGLPYNYGYGFSYNYGNTSNYYYSNPYNYYYGNAYNYNYSNLYNYNYGYNYPYRYQTTYGYPFSDPWGFQGEQIHSNSHTRICTVTSHIDPLYNQINPINNIIDTLERKPRDQQTVPDQKPNLNSGCYLKPLEPKDKAKINEIANDQQAVGMTQEVMNEQYLTNMVNQNMGPNITSYGIYCDRTKYGTGCGTAGPLVGFLMTYPVTMDEGAMSVIRHHYPSENMGHDFEIGYGLHAQCRGKGIMPLVVKEFTHQIKQKTPYIHLYAGALVTNEASQKVLTKAGYQRFGSPIPVHGKQHVYFRFPDY
jgi:RimJ/RimL family protein N-acetyltransferase